MTNPLILHQTIAPIPIEEVYELLMKGSKEKKMFKSMAVVHQKTPA